MACAVEVMAGIKSLAKDTAIYGLSSIIGRFLNWCLVPLYTQMFPADEYGVVTYVYSAVALALIVLTYGMETGFFRFANHERYKDPLEVYSTALISLGVSSTVFVAMILSFIGPVSDALHAGSHHDYIVMMTVAVALDAFTALPFSYLRYAKRPLRFASLRLVNIAVNIGLNLFFILICPWLWECAPGWIAWFYDPDFGIGYIFLANLVSSVMNVVLLVPELKGFRWRFNPALWREMLAYSAPLLVLGVAGIMNQTLGTLLMPWLYADNAEGITAVGIYGANYKIAIVMGMIDVQMAGVIRSYVPDREAPLATVHMKDSIYWAESADYMPILDKVLPSPENALRGAGKYFGAKVYANFVPHWEKETRWYFTGMGSRWKEASVYAGRTACA